MKSKKRSRVVKENTGLFFDAFKHLKNNITNLVFLELPDLVVKGKHEYLQTKPVNYKSKFPDMKKIGLIEDDIKNKNNYLLTEDGSRIYAEIVGNEYISSNASSETRRGSIGKNLLTDSYFDENNFTEIKKPLLSLILNYYDEGTVIRPYFLLTKFIFEHEIKYLNDDKLLDILSTPIKMILEGSYQKGSFKIRNKELQSKIKRPVSYMKDFLKVAAIFNNKMEFILNKHLYLNLIDEFNRGVSEDGVIYIEHESRSIKKQREFREKLLKIYNYKCAVTGKSVSYLTKYNTTNYILDAAHLIPYSEGGSFSANNGILLSPEIHKYLDNRLLYFEYNDEDEIIVRVSKSKNILNNDGLEELEGVKILMPTKEAFFPEDEALDYLKSVVMS